MLAPHSVLLVCIVCLRASWSNGQFLEPDRTVAVKSSAVSFSASAASVLRDQVHVLGKSTTSRQRLYGFQRLSNTSAADLPESQTIAWTPSNPLHDSNFTSGWSTFVSPSVLATSSAWHLQLRVETVASGHGVRGGCDDVSSVPLQLQLVPTLGVTDWAEKDRVIVSGRLELPGAPVAAEWRSYDFTVPVSRRRPVSFPRLTCGRLAQAVRGGVLHVELTLRDVMPSWDEDSSHLEAQLARAEQAYITASSLASALGVQARFATLNASFERDPRTGRVSLAYARGEHSSADSVQILTRLLHENLVCRWRGDAAAATRKYCKLMHAPSRIGRKVLSAALTPCADQGDASPPPPLDAAPVCEGFADAGYAEVASLLRAWTKKSRGPAASGAGGEAADGAQAVAKQPPADGARGKEVTPPRGCGLTPPLAQSPAGRLSLTSPAAPCAVLLLLAVWYVSRHRMGATGGRRGSRPCPPVLLATGAADSQVPSPVQSPVSTQRELPSLSPPSSPPPSPSLPPSQRRPKQQRQQARRPSAHTAAHAPAQQSQQQRQQAASRDSLVGAPVGAHSVAGASSQPQAEWWELDLPWVGTLADALLRVCVCMRVLWILARAFGPMIAVRFAWGYIFYAPPPGPAREGGAGNEHGAHQQGLRGAVDPRHGVKEASESRPRAEPRDSRPVRKANAAAATARPPPPAATVSATVARMWSRVGDLAKWTAEEAQEVWVAFRLVWLVARIGGPLFAMRWFLGMAFGAMKPESARAAPAARAASLRQSPSQPPAAAGRAPSGRQASAPAPKRTHARVPRANGSSPRPAAAAAARTPAAADAAVAGSAAAATSHGGPATAPAATVAAAAVAASINVTQVQSTAASGAPAAAAPVAAAAAAPSALPLSNPNTQPFGPAAAAGPSAAATAAESMCTCLVCLDAPWQHGFLHGGSVHIGVCGECLAAMQAAGRGRGAALSCPVCRSEVERVVALFA